MIIYYTDIDLKPTKHSKKAAAYDIRSRENYTIKPGDRCLIKTGLYVYGDYAERIDIRPRSGLALKHGITVLNSPGTIDADYTGEISVILINHGDKEYKIVKGDRIAQMIPIIRIYLCIEYDKNIASRILDIHGKKRDGFGSTGVS